MSLQTPKDRSQRCTSGARIAIALVGVLAGCSSFRVAHDDAREQPSRDRTEAVASTRKANDTPADASTDATSWQRDAEYMDAGSWQADAEYFDAGGLPLEAGPHDAAPSPPLVVPMPTTSTPQRCDRNAAFGAPVPVGGVNTDWAEESFRLSPDGHTAYFTRIQWSPTSVQFYAAHRNDTVSAFGAIAPLGVPTSFTLIGPNETFDFSVTGDGLRAYFTSSPSGADEITSSARATMTDPFGPATLETGLTGSGASTRPFVREDGQVLYFSSGGLIARGVRTQGQFAMERVAEFDTFTGAVSANTPVVTPDDLTIYFVATSPPSYSDYDIWTATRDSLSKPFSAPHVIAELKTSETEFPSFATGDGCALYFVGLYAARLASSDVFVARRPLL